MTRSLIAAACALALAACGGKKEEDRSFTYGAPSAASSAQAGALETAVAASAGFAAAPNADGGYLVADTSSLIDALVGGAGFGAASLDARPTLRSLAAGGSRAGILAAGTGFDDPSCAVTSATGVTLTGCTVTVHQVSGATVIDSIATVNGWMTYTAASHTLAWDVTVGESVTMSGDTTLTMNGSIHLAGSLTVTATTIVGHLGSGVTMTVSDGVQSMSAGVEEAVDIDVTYVDAVTCATRVVGGTLEATRVWTARPQGATAADLPDVAALVTWTGCGTATIQYGTR